MKRSLTIEELKEYFMFSRKELKIINKKKGVNKLGFSVLFKFFQYNGVFPFKKKEIPRIIIEYISRQIFLEPGLFRQYKWNSRTFSFHKTQIREYFGFVETSLKINSEIKEWILSNISFQDKSTVKAALLRQYRTLKVISPSPGSIERIVSSIILVLENRLFERIIQNLPERCKVSIGLLIKEFSLEELGKTSKNPITFNELKCDPGRANLEGIFREVEKLKLVQNLKIPDDLFAEVPLRVIKKYKLRISSELISEIRGRNSKRAKNNVYTKQPLLIGTFHYL